MMLATGNNLLRSVRAPQPGGFTLVELILVMALLLIVLAVAAPSLAPFFKGRVLDSEARRFVSLARYGQNRAVSEGVPVILWIDAKQGSYGLQQEAGSGDVDTKAVEFRLGEGLSIEAADWPAASTLLTASAQTLASRQTADRNRPSLRFQPDGFISEVSPQSVVLRQETASANAGPSDSIWITQSRNRLLYEISTNSLPNTLR